MFCQFDILENSCSLLCVYDMSPCAGEAEKTYIEAQYRHHEQHIRRTKDKNTDSSHMGLFFNVRRTYVT